MEAYDSINFQIVSYGGSYLGRRSNNEDSLGRKSPKDPVVLAGKGRLYLVCDGMGGTEGGEVASQTAVETIIHSYYEFEGDAEACLERAILEASQRIAHQAQKDQTLSQMGSTVVAVVIIGDEVVYGHVGDSRIYLMRNDKINLLTRDHLYILETLGVSDEEAEDHPNKHILSRALGYLHSCEPSMGNDKCLVGDRILLCSDGLSDVVDQDEIKEALQHENPRIAVDSLLRLAESRDARDNTTALVIYMNHHNPMDGETIRDMVPLEAETTTSLH